MLSLWLLSQSTTPRIETVWPTSIAGWVGLVIAIIALGGQVIALWRADKRPILDKMETQKTEFTKALAATRTELERMLNGYHDTVSREVQLVASRVDEDREEIQRNALAIEEQARRMIEQQTIQKTTIARLEDLSREVKQNTTETIASERRMGDKMLESERRIIEALARFAR